MSTGPTPIVVLLSGRGSNLQAILDAVRNQQLPVAVRAVICNNPQAAGLRLASQAGVPTEVIDHRRFTDRSEFDQALMPAIDRHGPALVVLAGFMRILGPGFIQHYAGRLINIHPSLLPAFTGLNTHARALAAGVREHGASVHYVTNDLDGGPVIAQAHVPVLAGDTAERLSERVLEAEHHLFPTVLRWLVEQRVTLRDGQVLLDGTRHPDQGLTGPDPVAEAS